MKNTFSIIVVVILVVAVVVLYSTVFQLQEGKQAVVTQFGRPVRSVSQAGLHVKMPFVQDVHLLEKRLLPWDGAAESMQTGDKKRIFINIWARWHISNVDEFFRAVRTETQGQKILDDLVDSAVRNVVANNDLIDVVRSSDKELKYASETMTEIASEEKDEREVVTMGRGKMEDTILEKVVADLKANNYGMELVTVKVKRVNYISSVKNSVYERMRSERNRIAMLFESEAKEEQNRILGTTQKELDAIEGEMEEKSARIHGEADAKVIAMTAEAYNKSPEFYSLLRRLEVFKQALVGKTRLILTTDSELLKLIKGATLELEPSEPATE
ncbi:MAG: protease modulator HflC [Pirellulaceae bacterium]